MGHQNSYLRINRIYLSLYFTNHIDLSKSDAFVNQQVEKKYQQNKESPPGPQFPRALFNPIV